MREQKTKIREERETVTKYKCDDCGKTGSREEMATLAHDPKVVSKESQYYGGDEAEQHDWTDTIKDSIETFAYKLLVKKKIDLCWDCFTEKKNKEVN